MTYGSLAGRAGVGVGAQADRRSSAAQPLAVPARWTSTGCDARAVWGRCIGTSAEPYECAVDHVDVAFRCSCPSRIFPCKHALALLLLWARGQVAEGSAPPFAATWIAKRLATAAEAVCRDRAGDSSSCRYDGRGCRRRLPARPCRLRRSSRARPATTASPGWRPGSPSSTAGSTIVCAPASPIRRWPATRRGTSWRRG